MASYFVNTANCQNYSVINSNSSNCTWEISFFTSGSVKIGLTQTLAANSSNPSCAVLIPTLSVCSYVEIVNPSIGCTVTFPVGPGSQTGITAYCGTQCTVVNPTDVISVTWAPANCSGVFYNEITVTITP